MNERRNAARILITFTALLLLFLTLPMNGRDKSSINSMGFLYGSKPPSSAEVWVDRGCGSHYRDGETITIFFEVTSPASKAVVTLFDHAPGGTKRSLIRSTYSANTVHSVAAYVSCPSGLGILELTVTIPPYYLPPEMISINQEYVHVFDTCHYYIDPPCNAMDIDEDGFYAPYDCDDANSLIYPGGEEVCDGKDNDCDGLTDEGCYTCLADWDNDSFPECLDCNDHDYTIYPGTAEICDGKDNDCDGLIDEGCCVCYDDLDRDGYSDCWDCNDNDPTVYPGATERCDQKDNNCNGLTDESWCDYVEIWVNNECGGYYNDGEVVDVYFSVHSSTPTASVTITDYHPQGASEILVSERIITTNKVYHMTTTASCPLGLDLLIITATVTVKGDPVVLADDCGFYVVNCRGNDYDGDGHDSQSSGGDDCDDSDPSIYPGAGEVCDGKDNDCNGYIDEGFDCDYVEIWVDKGCGEYYDDRDEITIYFRVYSSAPVAIVTLTDYPPQGAPRIMAETKTVATNKTLYIKKNAECGGLETLIIEATVTIRGVEVTFVDDCSFYVINCKKPDDDGDGYRSIFVGGDDCDDSDPDVHPGAEELCDQHDNDCDGVVDMPDNDTDGYISFECGGNDCDDKDPTVYPGAEEMYDGKDNDCDGEIDEGITMEQIDYDQDGYPLSVDCNDRNSGMYPGASEQCNDGIDNDCDGKVDCEDEDCEGDLACKGFDVSWIFPLIEKYKYFLMVGVAAVVAVALVLVFLRRRRAPRVKEEVPPTGAAEVMREERKEGIFERARMKKRKKKEEKKEEELELEEELPEIPDLAKEILK